MSASQARNFAATYTVIDQYTHPTNGLSVTVFETVATGEKYLAIFMAKRGMMLKYWVTSFYTEKWKSVCLNIHAHGNVGCVKTGSEIEKPKT